jgi:hypothetical protein
MEVKTMLIRVYKCIRRLGRVERLIRFLTVVRLAVFAAAMLYAVVTAASVIKQNCCR